ncbi:MAG TPA: CpsB/CapC family capsule biosynthesis tyrosine phosphatase [Thermoleophilaceae bacterium]|jgi:protein-tyrosine phosphatase|nr:CpsB/CapC family capsule biosynthesis tyrosine phosphatase [Thermoleophilaceae bacterium]
MDRTLAGRAEIHFHILPGVDDGPATMEDSLELARLAIRDGTRTVVATPHVRGDYLTDVHELPQRVRELNARLRLEGIPLEVVQGAEVGPDMVGSLDARGFEQVAVGPPGARWILLEPPFQSLAGVLAAAAELRARGYTVVMAHPERSAGVLSSGCRLLREELAAGTLAQISVSSLLGHHGSDAQIAARHLIETHMVHFVASDAHSPERPPALGPAMDALLAQGRTFAEVRRLVETGPRDLVVNGVHPRFAVAA